MMPEHAHWCFLADDYRCLPENVQSRYFLRSLEQIIYSWFEQLGMCALVFVFLTCPVIGLVAGVRDLCPQLQVVPSLVVGRAVGAQRKHAAGEARQVAHLPLQVAVLPLTNECQTTVGFAYQVALNGLEGEGGSVSVCEGMWK